MSGSVWPGLDCDNGVCVCLLACLPVFCLFFAAQLAMIVESIIHLNGVFNYLVLHQYRKCLCNDGDLKEDAQKRSD